MIFGIDTGNTNIVIGGLDGNRMFFTERIATDISKTELEYAILFKNLLDINGISKDEIEGCIISSVVPPLNMVLLGACERILGKKAILIGPGVKTGLNILIDDPATLGADMVVGAVAAKTLYKKQAGSRPMIVIDMGTATTITLVDEKHCFRGGAIFPGVKLGFSALVSGTSLLPDIYIEKPKRCIGTSTVDSMRSGAILGTASLIDGMIERMEEEFGKPCAHIATGGLAPSVVSCCRHEIVCDDNLLLKGLWAIYQKNSGRSR